MKCVIIRRYLVRRYASSAATADLALADAISSISNSEQMKHIVGDKAYLYIAIYSGRRIRYLYTAACSGTGVGGMRATLLSRYLRANKYLEGSTFVSVGGCRRGGNKVNYMHARARGHLRPNNGFPFARTHAHLGPRVYSAPARPDGVWPTPSATVYALSLFNFVLKWLLE